jgi:hypothetical protein
MNDHTGVPVARDDPFYVGYLPMPRAYRRFLRVVLPLVLWAVMFAGFAILWPQRAPGSGAWETGEPITRVGVLIAEPYPMLVTGEGRDQRVTLLTEMGKRGARERALAFAGERVRIEGFRIHRDGREIVELVPGPDAITQTDGPAPGEAIDFGAMTEAAAREQVLLRGEILDSKCYLGAMRPGDGLAHRACAMLCIRGGIPAMLYSVRADGSRAYHLLLSAQGGPIDARFIERAGVPVVVRGRAARIGDLDVMFVDAVE